MNNGPVQIISNVNIVAAERVIYNVNGLPTSFSEMMALPNSQLDNTYWLPWYNNVDLDTQLRFGNVTRIARHSACLIGGQEMTSGCVAFEQSLHSGCRSEPAGELSRGQQRNGTDLSNVNIVAAERVIYKVNGMNTSFTEMMALPKAS